MDILDADHPGAGILDVGHSNLEPDRHGSRNPFLEVDGCSPRRNELPEDVPTSLRISRMLRVTVRNRASEKVEVQWLRRREMKQVGQYAMKHIHQSRGKARFGSLTSNMAHWFKYPEYALCR